MAGRERENSVLLSKVICCGVNKLNPYTLQDKFFIRPAGSSNLFLSVLTCNPFPTSESLADIFPFHRLASRMLHALEFIRGSDLFSFTVTLDL